MKWLLALLIVLNLLVCMVNLLQRHNPVNIHAQEVSPQLLKVLPADWTPPDQNSSAALSTIPPDGAVSSKAAAVLHQAAVSSQPVAKAAAKPAMTHPVAADSAKKSSASEPARNKPVCAEWGPLNETLLARVKGGIPLLHLAKTQVEVTSVADAGKQAERYWVYYPQQANGAVTQALVSELKTKGFDSYVVNSPGENKGLISLGLFSKQASAAALLQRLKSAGYDQARMKPRDALVPSSQLRFTRLNASQRAALEALQKKLTPGIALKIPACGQ